MARKNSISEKINEVVMEMRNTGVWINVPPCWVTAFEEKEATRHEGFNEWLQFVFLPNKLQVAENGQLAEEKVYIVPQAIKYLGSDIKKGKLLKLLIELDALS